MALDSTSGGASAESYLSVADADTYWSNRADATWAAADTADKEAALRKATQYLDATYIWPGVIAATSQALGWPRLYVTDHEEREINGIPTLIEQAAAELAKLALSAPLLAVESRSDIEHIRADTVEVTFKAGGRAQKTYALVDRLLAPISLRKRGGGTVRLVRG